MDGRYFLSEHGAEVEVRAEQYETAVRPTVRIVLGAAEFRAACRSGIHE
ncbi:MAG: hypothetical protein IRY85_20505 [Micromonosporaceae bacterium]|nr:hypothetical protein [Micromonosporaceae bacterium]